MGARGREVGGANIWNHISITALMGLYMGGLYLGRSLNSEFYGFMSKKVQVSHNVEKLCRRKCMLLLVIALVLEFL